ncbi:MAG: EF-hand domain-containing protein [Magnetospirillum sp.]|nr:EF-hand domain-containing protein [Magnetospirillum sp.]
MTHQIGSTGSAGYTYTPRAFSSVNGASQRSPLSDTAASATGGSKTSSASQSLSQSDLATAFQQFAAQLQAALLQVQGGLSATGPSSGSGDPPPDATERFAELDTDGSGAVSRDEFVAGRPDDVSEDQAESLFDRIAAENDNATELTAEQLRPQGPPPGQTAASSTASATAGELLDQLLAAIGAYRNTAFNATAASRSSVSA